MSEIRQNILTGEWVIIAPERAKRPSDLKRAGEKSDLPDFVPTCPFCPGNELIAADERFRLNDPGGKWLIRSVTNKFSVLSPHGEVGPSGEGFRNQVNGVGLHEVIIENPQHNLPAALYSQDHLKCLLETYINRSREFYSDPRIRHVILFKNQGEEAGASQPHSHSQIVGLPIIPGQIEERIERSKRFFLESKKCMSCWMIDQERADGGRLIAENDVFLAFVPYAALSQYHLWIFPKHHSACFLELDAKALMALSDILLRILKTLFTLLNNPAFNLVIRSLGPQDAQSPFFHWYLSMVPRISKAAGFELGTGMYVNSSSPEKNAQILREAATT